ncbi:hypothetical protein H257_08401 [Aphanomyces astaci]|uniref:Uncharacterized protein n=1 Tax=Aphanomyces astaci TaxID=112090 RepID=W4GEU9_APHAT|nr:hypothetical protein H257_08401 [Aphanomyces astaci]ETV78222.1 hypothetical protein H257_08401 [Aphanomyces astaci]|eukprot:XP_009832559.1 hypothetical protein H257_08401 [Aphanomyces astaci]
MRPLTDNTSALTWSSSLARNNAFSQELNRCLGLHHALHHLHVSASHIPGAINTHPDAGSRASREPYRPNWQSATAGWTPSPIPPQLRHAYRSSLIFTAPHWPHPGGLVTTKHGPATNIHNIPRNGYPLHRPRTPTKSSGPLRSWFSSFFYSKYQAVSGKPTNQTLQYSDVTFLDHVGRETSDYGAIRTVQVLVRSSKSDQQGRNRGSATPREIRSLVVMPSRTSSLGAQTSRANDRCNAQRTVMLNIKAAAHHVRIHQQSQSV